jgi:carbon monoxide dehydrogenase subunit G
MRLSFTGAPEITSPRAMVWERLMDPQFVAKSAPGVERVDVIDATHFKVITAFGVGSIKLKFSMNVELQDVDPPNGLTMKARGQAPGSAVEVAAHLKLEAVSSNLTRLDWKADTDVSGTVASVGARLLEGTARRLTDQFWKDFAAAASAA